MFIVLFVYIFVTGSLYGTVANNEKQKVSETLSKKIELEAAYTLANLKELILIREQQEKFILIFEPSMPLRASGITLFIQI